MNKDYWDNLLEECCKEFDSEETNPAIIDGIDLVDFMKDEEIIASMSGVTKEYLDVILPMIDMTKASPDYEKITTLLGSAFMHGIIIGSAKQIRYTESMED